MTPKPKRPGLKFNAATHRYWLDGKPVPGEADQLETWVNDPINNQEKL